VTELRLTESQLLFFKDPIKGNILIQVSMTSVASLRTHFPLNHHFVSRSLFYPLEFIGLLCASCHVMGLWGHGGMPLTHVNACSTVQQIVSLRSNSSLVSVFLTSHLKLTEEGS